MNNIPLSQKHGLKITSIYVIVSGCWIYFSDRLLGSFIENNTLLNLVQTYKGLFFVLVTSALLYYLITKHTSSIMRGRNRLEELFNEKQALLSELHHRVKNNLAIIAGLIELQAEHLEESSKKILRETQFRIYTLADIEELLYQKGDMANIPFHEFMEGLVTTLKGHISDGSDIKSQINELNLNINQAVPLALLVNEIFSQFRLNGPLDGSGTVQVTLSHYLRRKVSLELNFENTPPEILSRLRDSKHIEATLINLYTKQLRAESEWSPTQNGGKYKIQFEKSHRPGSSSRMAKVG